MFQDLTAAFYSTWLTECMCVRMYRQSLLATTATEESSGQLPKCLMNPSQSAVCIKMLYTCMCYCTVEACIDICICAWCMCVRACVCACVCVCVGVVWVYVSDPIMASMDANGVTNAVINTIYIYRDSAIIEHK